MEISSFIKVIANQHSAAISSNNELYVWGTGIYGEFLKPTKF